MSKKIADIRDESCKVIKQLPKGNSPKDDMKLIKHLEKEMKQAAANLEFELAAVLRDQLNELRGSQ